MSFIYIIDLTNISWHLFARLSAAFWYLSDGIIRHGPFQLMGQKEQLHKLQDTHMYVCVFLDWAKSLFRISIMC